MLRKKHSAIFQLDSRSTYMFPCPYNSSTVTVFTTENLERAFLTTMPNSVKSIKLDLPKSLIATEV